MPQKELTGHDIADFERLDAQITEKWRKLAQPLADVAALAQEIRDRRLFLVRYETYEDYAQQTFGRSALALNALIWREQRKASLRIIKETTDEHIEPVFKNDIRSKRLIVEKEEVQKPLSSMPTRKDPQHDCMWVAPEPLPIPRTQAMALFEHAFRLLEQAQRNEGVAANPLFNKAIAELRQVRVSFQSVLPGILDQVPAVKPRSRATKDELQAYCESIGLPVDDGEWFYDKMLQSGWKVDGRPVADCYATIRNWKRIGCMASQKILLKNGHTPPKPKGWASKELDAELARLRRGQ